MANNFWLNPDTNEFVPVGGSSTGFDINKMLGYGGLGAAGLGMLGGFFNKTPKLEDPSKVASPYFEKVPSTVTPYYQPYIDTGKAALPTVQSEYGKQISDPQALFKNVASGFQASPGFNFQVDQATKAANQAAAAGGMVGSPQEQQQLAQIVNQLANQDYYNYMGTALPSAERMYGLGLGGLEDLNKMGYGASTDLAQMLAEALMTQGNLAYQGANARNQNLMNEYQEDEEDWGSLLGAGLSAAAMFL